MPTTLNNEAYLHALLVGDKSKAASIARNTFTNSGHFKELYESLMKPALYEVGKLWEEHKISVATEHLATAITESILNQLYSQFELPVLSKKVVLACAPGEMHQVGLRMVADVFEANGWDTYFTGSNLPAHELLSFIQEQQPEMLAFSLSVFHNYSSLLTLLELVKDQFPNTPVLVGGQAFTRVRMDVVEPYGIKPFTDLHQLDKYLKNL